MMILLLCGALWDYSYESSIKLMYDSNIFTYSQEYIDDFLAQTAPYRFPFETYDDLYTELQLDMRFRKMLFANRTTTLNMGGRIRHYAVNPQKGSLRMIAGLRQSLGTWAIKVSYRLLPGYLIRYYKNPEHTNTEYFPCRATYHTFAGKVTLPRISIFTPAVQYQHSIDDYLEPFTIYDARAHTVGLHTDVNMATKFHASAHYAFELSELDTTLMPGDTIEDIPDGSYLQQAMGMSVTLKGIVCASLTFSLGYEYTFRNYRSEDSDDRLHFGRQDHLHSISIGAVLWLRTGMLLHGFYTHRSRIADSEVFPEIDMIKNYAQDRTGAGLSFYF